MVVKINPATLWEYFQKNQQEFSEGVVVAYDIDNDIEVTAFDIGGELEINITDEEFECLFDEIASTADECELYASQAIEFAYDLLNSREFPIEGFEDECMGEIEDRETELKFAVQDYLSTLLGEDYKDTRMREIEKQLVDLSCKWLASTKGISVYRPAIITIEGKEEYVEYPYDKIIDEGV